MNKHDELDELIGIYEPRYTDGEINQKEVAEFKAAIQALVTKARIDELEGFTARAWPNSIRISAAEYNDRIAQRVTELKATQGEGDDTL